MSKTKFKSQLDMSAVKAVADAANSESEVEAFTQELHENTNVLQRLGDSMDAIHEATEATKKEVKDGMERVSNAVKKYEEKTAIEVEIKKNKCLAQFDMLFDTIREHEKKSRTDNNTALDAHAKRMDLILEKAALKFGDMMTVVIPPETYEMQKQVFAIYIKMFKEELAATVKAGLADSKSDFDNMHQDLARTEKRLANVGSRIAVPATLCYCCFITLFISLAFLIMTIWAIGIEDYGQKIATTAIKFGWITGIANAVIIAYSIWYHRH